MHNEEKDTFQFASSIPVLRMLDEAKARAFYLDYLGYEVDWEHRFSPQIPGSPLYMQISHGDSVLHLNGHTDKDAPTSEVRISVKRLEAYCEFFRAKAAGSEKPEVVDPRYTGRKTDMNIYDPFGNLLVFRLAERSQ
jgi:hypothetical protein